MHPEEMYDVIVVGAGPGGSNAARVALSHGLSVAQVDRNLFPRIKPCGGGMTTKSVRALEVDFHPVLRGEFAEVQFNVHCKRANVFGHLSLPILRMVDRPQFDNWLVEQNCRSPRFRFFGGQHVDEISYDGVFNVRARTVLLRGKQLVGADGAYSIVNRRFGVTDPKGRATAVEVILRRDEVSLGTEIPPCFDFGAVNMGYGWVFPKDDHWNVGLYTLAKNKQLRPNLLQYIRDKGFATTCDPLATFKAHQFPYGGYKINVPSAPVYVVGDAGGFGDPLMGEGIYHALETGRIAGNTIRDCLASKASHADYYRRIQSSVLSDTLVTYQIAREFYRNVGKAVTILENPFVWRPLVQGYAEGATFSAILRRGGWFLSKSIVKQSLMYTRRGQSEAFSLIGPFRGLVFLLEPLFRKAQRLLRSVGRS
jgi:geranylgeranyl reductase family protein